jgi:bifunctional DNA-binding transcriptional regulator/antitoxin component of YhaV-PrlF toxin-antitoxin module
VTAIVFSTKGQVVIPKALRDAHGFKPGVIAQAVAHPEGVLIRAVASGHKRPISELSGMLAKFYTGPALSVEEMHEGVASWFEADPQWKTPKHD